MNIETYDELLAEWKRDVRATGATDEDIAELQETGIDTFLGLRAVGFTESEGWHFVAQFTKEELDENQIRDRVIELLNPN